LEICRRSASNGDEMAALCLDGMLGVINGQKDAFELVYPCHSPEQRRWFVLYVTPYSKTHGKWQVIAAHFNISHLKD